MAAAMERVIDTPELLEAILLHLSFEPGVSRGCECCRSKHSRNMKTLLLSQRTCKAFRATIAGSPKLQRALFFKQSSRQYSEPIPNPLVDAAEYFYYSSDQTGSKVYLDIGHGRAYVYVGFTIHDSDTTEASWGRMYLQNVPGGVTEVGWTGRGEGELALSGALTIGEMVDEVLAFDASRR